MKIAIFNSLYWPHEVGGAERSVRIVAEELQALGNDVDVFTLHPKESEEVSTLNGVSVNYLPLRNWYWPFSGGKFNQLQRLLWHARDTFNPQMRELVREKLSTRRYDILYTNNLAGFSVAIWESAKDLAIPIVHSPRDYYILCPRSTLYKGRRCSSTCMECMPFKARRVRESENVDVVVGASQFILTLHQKHSAFSRASKFAVVPNPVSPVEPMDGEETRGDLTFGYLGRLEEEKGFLLLLESTRKLPTKGWRLNIGGTGSSAIHARVKEYLLDSRIAFMGGVHASQFFKSIDVLIVPSLWDEPFGRVVIEAYSVGVPVIASNRGALPEIVEEGRTGFVIDPDDRDSLANAMRKFILREVDISALRKNATGAAKAYTTKRTVSTLMKIFEERVGVL